MKCTRFDSGRKLVYPRKKIIAVKNMNEQRPRAEGEERLLLRHAQRCRRLNGLLLGRRRSRLVGEVIVVVKIAVHAPG